MRIRRPQSQSSPEHWSKDFVEHLRTVHFALMTVAIGLVIVLSSKTYNARVAASQLNEITTTLKWIHGDAKPNLPESVFTSKRAKEIEMYTINPSPAFTATVLSNKSDAGILIGEYSEVTFSLGRNRSICTNYNGKYNETYNAAISASDQPTTIRQLTAWWNDRQSSGALVSTVKTLRPFGVRYNRMMAASRNSSDQNVSLNQTDAAKGELPIVTLDTTPCVVNVDNFRLTALIPKYRYVFDVYELSVVEVSQASIAKAFSDINIGPFSQAFADLAAAARGREDESFDTLVSKINDEARKSDEAFDAFGIKFPSEQVTRWGIILLIGVQLYFVMYLKRLCKKLKADDPGWDVPWMAMDESKMARVMFIISILVIPICAAVFVLIRSESGWFTDGFTWHLISIFEALNWSDRMQFILIPAAVLGSALLSVLAWRYRPKLSEPVAHSQLFE